MVLKALKVAYHYRATCLESDHRLGSESAHSRGGYSLMLTPILRALGAAQLFCS